MPPVGQNEYFTIIPFMKTRRSLSTLAVLFIITGSVLTLENFHVISGISRHWPLVLMLAGAGFLLLFFKDMRFDPALVWIGTFLLPLGGFFYFLNFTSWKHIAHLWPLFLGFVGISFLATTIFAKSRIFLYISIMFVMLFSALWLVFTVSLRLWPLSFIIFGLSLLLINFFAKKERTQ
jgi:hypothetical protein